MPYCQYCGEEIDEDTKLCPKCGENLVGEGIGWQKLQIQEKIDEAIHRANMYTISSIVLVTLGIVAGGILCVSLSLLGFCGIVLVCLGIGCIAPADRYGNKAQNLKNRLRREIGLKLY